MSMCGICGSALVGQAGGAPDDAANVDGWVDVGTIRVVTPLTSSKTLEA